MDVSEALQILPECRYPLPAADLLYSHLDAILVKVYFRLGRMWAVELSYPNALEWLNKAMKIPHDDQMERQINEILVTISQLKMRERASGKGY